MRGTALGERIAEYDEVSEKQKKFFTTSLKTYFLCLNCTIP